MRDARITQIYEGTNGIQALDLIGRKLGLGTGRLLRRFFHPVAAFIEEAGAEPAMAEFVLPLAKAFARLQQVTAQIAQAGLQGSGGSGGGGQRLSQLLRARGPGLYVGPHGPRRAGASRTAMPAGFYKAKLATARFFMARLLPQQAALFQMIGSRQGDADGDAGGGFRVERADSSYILLSSSVMVGEGRRIHELFTRPECLARCETCSWPGVAYSHHADEHDD